MNKNITYLLEPRPKAQNHGSFGKIRGIHSILSINSCIYLFLINKLEIKVEKLVYSDKRNSMYVSIEVNFYIAYMLF